jgi:hypothetical protein
MRMLPVANNAGVQWDLSASSPQWERSGPSKCSVAMSAIISLGPRSRPPQLAALSLINRWPPVGARPWAENINSTRATAHDGHAVFRSVMPYKLAIPIILDRETSDNHRYSQQNKDGETAVIQRRSPSVGGLLLSRGGLKKKLPQRSQVHRQWSLTFVIDQRWFLKWILSISPAS